MKKHWHLLLPIFLLFLLPSCSSNSDSASADLSTPWEHPMYLGHAGYWENRIPVVVQNHTGMDLKGDPFTLTVGKGKGKLALKGVQTESIRVTNSKGEQLKCRVDAPDGRLLERGPIPNGAILTLPMENKAGENASYFVYFENDKAWAVGEYLFTHREISNGGFETEGSYGPLNWELSWPEEQRDVKWSDEKPHSGQKCIEIIGGSPDGRENYGAEQANIHLIPGAVYEVGAWFRSENLEGEAGLMMRAANLARTKMGVRPEAFKLEAQEGTQNWQYASMEFTAPEDVNILSISTFIEGKGKLWVDDLSFKCKHEYHHTAQVHPVENLPVNNIGQSEDWMGEDSDGSNDWPVRASVTVQNFTDVAMKDYPVYADIQMLKQRLFEETDESTLMQLSDGTTPIPYMVMGSAILFKQDIPALTNRTFYLYFSSHEQGSDKGKLSLYDELSQITQNLVANSQFEQAGMESWERFGESGTRTITESKEGDNPMAQLSYRASGDETEVQVSDIEESHTVSNAEIGMAQVFKVNPGSKYFFSARVKSSNILDRTETLRAGFLDEQGEFIQDKETRRANPDMHQSLQWVSESMIIEAPPGSASIRIELVNTVEGQVWYDDVFFMEVGTGFTGAMSVERKAEKDLEGLQIWEKNPVAKVFPDDLPKAGNNSIPEKLAMSAARNDTEPIQILFRSQEEYTDLELFLVSPEDNQGNRLEESEIGIVGYVPISYPSNYIRDFVTPFWQTILPKGTIGSDGWTGWWADPILPFHVFDLPANKTTAGWIEISVPDDAVPGIYTGSIQLLHKGGILKEIPLEIQVYAFTLPEENNVKATYVTRFNNREIFGRKLSEDQWKDELWEYMARHRISSKMVEPQPEARMVDGEVVLDFTEFDKAAAYYFDTLKISSTWSPQYFYLFGWGRPPSDKFGEKPYPGEYPYHDADHSTLRPEYKRVYQSALKQYWDHMKEKGWADKSVIYISDEPHADEHMNQQMYAVCDMIHEVDPEIPIYVSTWWYRPEFEGYVDVWGVSHRGGGWGHPVPAEHLEQIRKNGGDIYFTTDGMQCTDSPYLGFERMLPYFCYKYEAKEYEFWASNWHTLDPYNYGWHRFHRQSPSVDVVYWMRYPNGDGNFIYPGEAIGADPLVASIRLKQAREGVEDFEFMHILGQLIEKANTQGISSSKAQAALDRTLDLVSIPCADGRYTTEYMPDPDLLMDVRHGIATAIEELSPKIK